MATPEDAEGIARVHVTAWAETYAGLLPPEALAEVTVLARTNRWRAILSADGPDSRQAGVAVLEINGTVQGFASWCGQRNDDLRAQGFDGEISAIYLLRAVQGQGHGRALMGQAARSLLARGHQGAGLWVFRDNRPARDFYERLGGVVCGEQPDTLGGAPIFEVAYAWPSLSAMIAPTSPTIGVGSCQ